MRSRNLGLVAGAVSIGALAATLVTNSRQVRASDPSNPTVYGDGSAGSHTVTGNEDWTVSPPTNLSFTNFTVSGNATLTVPSGTVIRCTGTFTNAGTVTVSASLTSGGSIVTRQPASLVHPAYRAPAIGVARSLPQDGEIGSQNQRTHGSGAVGLLELEARQLLHPGVVAGGGGAGNGGDGGGSLVVLALNGITNSGNGVISANGVAAPALPPFGGFYGGGGGGGAGGVIVLASKTSVVNNGSIAAIGAAGTGPTPFIAAAGGGGGGGIVHLLAPSVTSNGTVNVNGGPGGPLAPQMYVNGPVGGGPGGGACGGSGGDGGDVGPTFMVYGDGNLYAPFEASSPGGTGRFLTSLVDPSPLY